MYIHKILTGYQTTVEHYFAMIRIGTRAGSIVRYRTQSAIVARCKSSKAAGDEGFVGTKLHHHANTVLALIFPVAFLGSDGDTGLGQGLGVLTAGYVSIHSYIGLNYVITDYVPKFFGKGAVGPVRALTTGLSLMTFLGMSKMALYSPGGIQGVVKGLWTGKPKDESSSQ